MTPLGLLVAIGPVLYALVIAAVGGVLVLLFAEAGPDAAGRTSFAAIAGVLLGHRVDARGLADVLPLSGASLIPYGIVVLSATIGARSPAVRRIAASRRINLPMLVTAAALTLVATIAVRVVAPDTITIDLRILSLVAVGVGTWLLTTWAARSVVARRVVAGIAVGQLAALAVVLVRTVAGLEGETVGRTLVIVFGALIVGLAASAMLVAGATVYPVFGAIGDGFAGLSFRDGAEINEWVWLLPLAVIVGWLSVGYRNDDAHRWRAVRGLTLRATGVAAVVLLVVGTTGGLTLGGETIGLIGMPFRALPSLLLVAACIYLGTYLRGVRRSAPWATTDQLVADVRDIGRAVAEATRRLQASIQAAIDEDPDLARHDAPPASTHAAPTGDT